MKKQTGNVALQLCATLLFAILVGFVTATTGGAMSAIIVERNMKLMDDLNAKIHRLGGRCERVDDDGNCIVDKTEQGDERMQGNGFLRIL
jgi:hypothetical protein